MAVTSFCIMYGFMESPVPDIIHFVCARAHHPPKEVQTMHKKYVSDAERALLHKREIPPVSSREERRRFPSIPSGENAAFAKVVRIEKSMI